MGHGPTVHARRARSWQRVRRRLKVTLSGRPCFVVDIGEGGFCAEIFRVRQPGTRLEGVLHVGPRQVRFEGLVAWASEGAPYVGVRGRMGVMFTSPRPTLEEVVGPWRGDRSQPALRTP